MKDLLGAYAIVVNLFALVWIGVFLMEIADGWSRTYHEPAYAVSLLPMAIVWCFTFYMMYKTHNILKKKNEKQKEETSGDNN